MALFIDIDTTSLKAFIARLQQMEDDAPTFTAMAVDAVAAEGTLLLQQHAPRDDELNNGVIPGEEDHLQDSFSATTANEDVVSEAQIMTGQPIKYGYVTNGTEDVGPIVPVNAKALSFYVGGNMHSFRQVAGQKANPFQLEALAELETELPDIIDPFFQAWIGVP